jgi:hypothetical protein
VNYFEQSLKDFSQPEDNQVLWRFVSFPSFVYLLENKVLIFRRAKDQADKWEGAFSPATLEFRREQFEAQNTTLDSAVIDAARAVGKRYLWERIYISCWYAESEESFAMWRLYGSQERGQTIGLRTTWGALRRSLGNNDLVSGALVKYIDYNKRLIRDYVPGQSATAYPIEAFFYKRNAFRYESEFRLVTINHADHPILSMDEVAIELLKASWLEIDIDLQGLFDEVVADPESEEWFSKLLSDVCKRYGLNIPVRRSSLADSPITWD